MCLANHKITQTSTRFLGTIGKSGCYHCILKFYRGARVERRGSERNDEVCSRAFEKICVEFLLANPPFDFTRIGSWWHGEREIDIVALNDNTNEILFCECKYTNMMVDTDIYHNLLKKTGYVKWGSPERRGTYYRISRSGFTKKMKKLAAVDGVPLFDLTDLERSFSE